jgi:glycosyltransferase involved in cell wall biosynthesis
MTGLTVSVVIVSRGRAAMLRRCLLGVSQLQFDSFEVIVVADPAGIGAAQGLPFADHLKCVTFDEPNISAARNIGISHAAGEIVAFIDDDAVPEPQWLRYLTAPAAQSDVAAMGGYVRGRNGISWQWTAHSLDAMGMPHPLEIDPSDATVLRPPKSRAIKTEGTNMAFRRSVLVELGGFDTAFHYYLEETDLNMRLARAGYATALVPLAEVHHGFAPNAMRTQNRVPTDLFDIGASWAVFQRKHIADADRLTHWTRLRGHERKRLLRHLISGGMEPGGVRRLMRRLDEGYSAGMARPFETLKVAAHPAGAFRAFPSAKRRSFVMSEWFFGLTRSLKDARERVKGNEIVTVLLFSPTTFYHKVFFNEDGVWVQKGGLFGRSEREKPVFRLTTISGRTQQEIGRVARQRGISHK